MSGMAVVITCGVFGTVFGSIAVSVFMISTRLGDIASELRALRRLSELSGKRMLRVLKLCWSRRRGHYAIITAAILLKTRTVPG